MPTFKDIIALDQSVFINPDEFGTLHTINKNQLNVVVDNDRLMERSKVEYEGVMVGEILYFVKAADYGPIPKQDEVQIFDGIPCFVFDVRSDMGMYEIILKKNVS